MLVFLGVSVLLGEDEADEDGVWYVATRVGWIHLSVFVCVTARNNQHGVYGEEYGVRKMSVFECCTMAGSLHQPNTW